MAKNAQSGEVNKSDAIRDYIKNNPDDGPKAVSAALANQGIDVSAAFVSTVKSTDKRKTKRRGKKTRKATTSTKASAGSNSASLNDTIKALENVKELVDRLGGVSAAKQAVDAYAKLVR